MKSFLFRTVDRVRSYASAFTTAALIGGASLVISLPSQAQVTLPDIGVSIPDHITAAGTDLGTIITAALGLGVTMLVIFVGWVLMKKLIKGGK